MDTTRVRALFESELAVVNLGLASFAVNLRRSGAKAINVDWRPAGGGDPVVQAALDRCLDEHGGVRAEIAAATRQSVERLLQAKPVIVGIGRALDVIPGMRRDLVLHAGPPVAWERMSGPTRGAVMGGLVHEGLAPTPEAAARLAASGAVEFAPCHHHASVGPMAGIVTASMPVWILENATFGNRAYATLNEGLGRSCATGPTTRRSSRGSSGWSACWRRCCVTRWRPTVPWTCAASSPRRCRWATRSTTAIAPPPRS